LSLTLFVISWGIQLRNAHDRHIRYTSGLLFPAPSEWPLESLDQHCHAGLTLLTSPAAGLVNAFSFVIFLSEILIE
jgi:hypothetical protein